MLLPQLEAAIAELGLAGRRILLGVSGGVDSTVLAHCLAELAEGAHLELAIGHVNHGLRGRDADEDEAFVDELAGRLSLPFFCRAVDPQGAREGGSSRERPTLQEAARRLRREALEEMRVRAGADHVATAHQADDQAETVLMRILRGCGPDSIGGIPEMSADGTIVRPLLAISRAEIVAHAKESDLSWREDASNADPAYTRSRIRSRDLPNLRDYNPQLLRAIGDLAEAQRRDSEWLELLVGEEAARWFRRTEAGLEISAAGLVDLPEALARRLVRRALIEMGGGRDLSRVHLLRALDFLRSARRGTRLELPGGLVLRCEGDVFRLQRLLSPPSQVP